MSNPSTPTVKGFKGFDKDLKCRDVQYKVGETYTHKGSVKLCESGIHFCEDPLDVLAYYAPSESRFAEVSAEGVSSEVSDDSKRVSKSLTIEAEISLAHLITTGIKFRLSKYGGIAFDLGNDPAPGVAPTAVTPVIIKPDALYATGNPGLVSINPNAISGNIGESAGQFFCPTIGTTSECGINIGTQYTNFNNLKLTWVQWGGAGSTSNYAFWGVNTAPTVPPGICITGAGTTGIGYSTNGACPMTDTLTVNGTVAATSYNGVALSTAGSATSYLDGTGNYSVPAGGGGGGGTVGSGTIDGIAYYTGTTTTGSTTAPTTLGHTFVPAWQPSGSAVAPVPLDLATYLASPPVIGGTTPAAGTFTTLNASSIFSINGISGNILTASGTGGELVAGFCGSPATSGSNTSSCPLQWDASYWDGTIGQLDIWQARNVSGTGTNPTQTLNFSHSGSPGLASITFPNVTGTRITKRTGTTTSSGTPTINTDTVDFYSITALAANITSFTTNLSGTPTQDQTLWISITDNGTARTLAWGASFEASTIALPTTTVISTRMDVGFVWDTVTSKWRCIAVA